MGKRGKKTVYIYVVDYLGARVNMHVGIASYFPTFILLWPLLWIFVGLCHSSNWDFRLTNDAADFEFEKK